MPDPRLSGLAGKVLDGLVEVGLALGCLLFGGQRDGRDDVAFGVGLRGGGWCCRHIWNVDGDSAIGIHA